jgi:hypothetical protein
VCAHVCRFGNLTAKPLGSLTIGCCGVIVAKDCLIWAKYKKKKKFDWAYCGHIMFGSCILSANAVKGVWCVCDRRRVVV